jgi:hypothetical protein
MNRLRQVCAAGLERASAAVPRRPDRLAHDVPAFEPDIVRAAVERGVAHLRRQQRRDGALRDFALQPGLSDAWTTAHCALVLKGVPQAWSIRRAAADFLYARGCRRGAWGFNDRVEEDADSTAQALLVLAEHRHAMPGAWTDVLLGFQLPGGGFSTFRAPPTGPVIGWQAPHADVTLAALAAVRMLGLDPAAAARAEQFLARCGDVATAYWWATPAYAPWAHAQFGVAPEAAARRALDLLPGAAGPVDVALLGRAARPLLDAATRRDIVVQLVATQWADGSWPCSPCLRVTDPALHSSRLVAPGRIYHGTRRVFSTAHAVACLAHVTGSVEAARNEPSSVDPGGATQVAVTRRRASARASGPDVRLGQGRQ